MLVVEVAPTDELKHTPNLISEMYIKFVNDFDDVPLSARRVDTNKCQQNQRYCKTTKARFYSNDIVNYFLKVHRKSKLCEYL